MNTLKVIISSPDKIIWEGPADSVSSVNSQGPFDILPMHSNFISIIEGKPITVKTGTQAKEYSFPRSVIYTHNNTVKIYTNLE
jgi:F0F1-type ATP synthase epsilon subunit